MMHILLTGGCGYIGTLLTEQLLARGFRVTVVDTLWFGNYLPEHKNLTVLQGDIRNTNLLPDKGVDVIIHLANIANDPCVELDPTLSWEVNALGTMQLAEYAVRHGVKQFIYSSSGSVYGVKEEEQVTEELKPEPISVYNKTKMVGERILLSYKDAMIVQCIRPATVCGYSPRMRLDLSVNLLTMQALAKGKITVFGGNQMRPNIHVRDIVGVFLHFLSAGDKIQGIYNAGFENMSILQIAQTVTKYVPAEIAVSESQDPRSYRLNADKLLATGFSPRFSVETAIKEIVEAFRVGKLKDEEKYYNLKWMKRTVVN